MKLASGEQSREDLGGVHVGQPFVASLAGEAQALEVEPEQVQHRRVQVGDAGSGRSTAR